MIDEAVKIELYNRTLSRVLWVCSYEDLGLNFSLDALD